MESLRHIFLLMTLLSLPVWSGDSAPSTAATAPICEGPLLREIRGLRSEVADLAKVVDALERRTPPQLGSIQVVVPLRNACSKCINNCGFCNALMSDFDMGGFESFDEKARNFYRARLEFARDKGIDTMVITGVTEPQQNKAFLEFLAALNKTLTRPFYKIEFQTTGVILDDKYLDFLADGLGVTMINLSTSAIDSEINARFNGTPPKVKVDIKALAERIRARRMGLRMSLNWTEFYDDKTPQWIVRYVREELGAHQITVRRLYRSGGTTAQDLWIERHAGSDDKLAEFYAFIREKGERGEVLPFGAYRYSIEGMSVAVDEDCMNVENKSHPRYLILYPGGIHTRWRDRSSLIF